MEDKEEKVENEKEVDREDNEVKKVEAKVKSKTSFSSTTKYSASLIVALAVVYGAKVKLDGMCHTETYNPEDVLDWCRSPVDCDMCRNVDSIEEVHVDDLSKEEFRKKYARTSKPLVVRNATLTWPAMKKLSYKWLKELYTKDPNTLEYDPGEGDNVTCWFSQYTDGEVKDLKALFSMSRREVFDNSWYVGWAVCHLEVIEELYKIQQTPHFIGEDFSHPERPWIHMGGPGPGVGLHLDRVMMSSWQAQIVGVKSWTLRPPPECQSSCHDNLTTTVYPGDIIVVDANSWFHATDVEGDGLSMTMTFEYEQD